MKLGAIGPLGHVVVSVWTFINALADNTYTLSSESTVTAYSGRNNLVNLAFGVESPTNDTVVSESGCLDFSASNNDIAKIDVIVGDQILSYPGDHVVVEGDVLKVRFGKMNLLRGTYHPTVVIYMTGETNGIVLCGAEMPASFLLNYRT
tara:strand:- start:2351 stop:2797 length:447 start_codon:yes stop_codon:yes gene_type:complete